MGDDARDEVAQEVGAAGLASLLRKCVGTILAAERTYAAWVRTGLFALASGVGARALLTGLLPEWLIKADASMLVAFSVFCFAAAIWRHLNPGPPPPVPGVARIPRSVLVTVNLFLALVSLAALVGIWAGP